MTAKMIFCIFFIAITVAIVTGDKDYTADGHSSLLLIEKTNFISSESGNNIHLVFHPTFLDFDDLAVGDAESETVIVFNEHANKSVYFGSISGNVPDFYSSFFEDKVIPPMGNTTFNVVFLPRVMFNEFGWKEFSVEFPNFVSLTPHSNRVWCKQIC